MYEELLSDKVKVLKPSGIRKFFDLAATREGVISLGVGEPDFATPWHIREAAIYSIKQGKTFIPAMPDCCRCARKSAAICTGSLI